MYNKWYLITKSNFQKGHSVPKSIKSTTDPVGIRLLYVNLDQGYQDIDQIIAPREEINLYIKIPTTHTTEIILVKGLEFSKKYFQVKKKFFNIALKKILWIIFEKKKKKN